MIGQNTFIALRVYTAFLTNNKTSPEQLFIAARLIMKLICWQEQFLWVCSAATKIYCWIHRSLGLAIHLRNSDRCGTFYANYKVLKIKHQVQL